MNHKFSVSNAKVQTFDLKLMCDSHIKFESAV